MRGQANATWWPDAASLADLGWLIPEAKRGDGIAVDFAYVAFGTNRPGIVQVGWYGRHKDGRRHQRRTTWTWELDRETAYTLLPTELFDLYERWTVR